MTLASGGLAVEAPEARREVVDLGERTWLTRHCRGDASAFPALMEAYRRPVYSYLVRSGVVAADRDDLFQNVFLKIHAAAASYDASRPLGPWIFTIVANTVRNHFRGQAVPLAAIRPDDPPLDPPDPNPGPDRIAEARQTVAWLEQAIHSLPLAQREVLLLATVVGLPHQEIAEALNMPVNTVKTQLRRARLALSERLVERDRAADCAGENHE